jgi:hypothetical protein
MHCANSDCCCDAFDMPGGSLWLMELELSDAEPIRSDDNGFPVCSLPMRCFWLCVQCSRRFVLSRWTPAGIVLVPRRAPDQPTAAGNHEFSDFKPPISIHASASFEAEFQEAV